MAKQSTTPHELIRAVIDGDSRAKARLAKMGEPAVRPLLESMVGRHGRLGDTLPDLVDVLKRIARNDVDAIIPALKGHPAQNLVVWAVGYGAMKGGKVHPKALRALKGHRRHKDAAVRSVAAYHLEKIERGKTKKAEALSKKKVAPKRKAPTRRARGK